MQNLEIIEVENGFILYIGSNKYSNMSGESLTTYVFTSSKELGEFIATYYQNKNSSD